MARRRNVIALVDNDRQLREALGLLLSVFGYRTELFASGDQFLSAAATSEASCLIVETQLNGISGVELGRQLVTAGFNFPIIFLTRSRDESLQKQALDLGCVAYLHKSFLADRLIEAVEKAIGSNVQ